MGLQNYAFQLEKLLLKNATVQIKNRSHVRNVLCEFMQSGREKFQIISDFDYTISRFSQNGKPCDSTYQVVEASPLMPKKFREQTANLRNKYYPFCQNLAISEGIKGEAMQSWLRQSHDLMKEFKVRQQDIPKMVQLSSVFLRSNVSEFLSVTSLKNIPVTIFSAGLTMVVREILHAHSCMLDNITIVGNELLLNPKGEVAGVREPVVDSLNKSKIVSSRAEYFDKNKDRCNVLVVGDSMGDAKVADEMFRTNTVLKIGFFVHPKAMQFSTDIEQYNNVFDIVITDEESFAVVYNLVQYIFTNGFFNKHEKSKRKTQPILLKKNLQMRDFS